jgi:predicted glycoside hydrolase/deacetylase ChbG (UPF0249 family)
MLQTRIIINADDFGLTAPVNEAVAKAALEGVLSSATIMANMPGFEEAVKIAKSVPQLGVGVHLNLLRGKPLCEPSFVKSLTGKDENFLGSPTKLWRRSLLGQIDPHEIIKELSMQVSRVIDFGIRPTHVDSEKHVHIIFPFLWDAVCEAAKRHNIKCIRIIRENLRCAGLLPRPLFKQRLKTILLNRRGAGLAERARRHGLKFTDYFFGAALTGRMTSEVYCKLLPKLPAGSLEIMCHPAVSAGASESAGRKSWLDDYRVNEYLALIDPNVKESLRNSNIELINYGRL